MDTVNPRGNSSANSFSSDPDLSAIRIIRSSRRTLSLQVKNDGQVIVRAPKHVTLQEIAAFVRKNSAWLHKHLEKVRKEKDPLVGVTYGRITVRNQRTRWGSCSSKGNLNFNCLLMLAPPGILDYVVVHELCHRKEMNHSPKFWAEVAKVMPDYKERQKWLRTEGSSIMRRMTG